MARERFGVTFNGLEEMADKIDKLGGDLNKVVEECLEFIPDLINPKLETDIAPHRRKKTKSTADSIAKDSKVEWEGSRAFIPVGFHIKNGGLPSIFLMYGTARHTPKNQYGAPKKQGAKLTGMDADKKLYNDIYGTNVRRQIKEKQAEIFKRELEKLMESKQ